MPPGRFYPFCRFYLFSVLKCSVVVPSLPMMRHGRLYQFYRFSALAVSPKPPQHHTGFYNLPTLPHLLVSPFPTSTDVATWPVLPILLFSDFAILAQLHVSPPLLVLPFYILYYFIAPTGYHFTTTTDVGSRPVLLILPFWRFYHSIDVTCFTIYPPYQRCALSGSTNCAILPILPFSRNYSLPPP